MDLTLKGNTTPAQSESMYNINGRVLFCLISRVGPLPSDAAHSHIQAFSEWFLPLCIGYNHRILSAAYGEGHILINLQGCYEL